MMQTVIVLLGEWLSGSAGMGFTPHIITIAVGEVCCFLFNNLFFFFFVYPVAFI
jgi:hypothetical protein